MIFIASHARFDEAGEPRHGTASEISTFLQKNKKDYIFIKHSLYQGSSTLIESYLDDKVETKLYGFANIPFPLRVIQELIINFYFLLKVKVKPDVFVGVDPLNAFSAVISRKLGIAKRCVFYTADYAHRRFKNPIMNAIYHRFDSFAANNADQVWNVSSRIVKEREKQEIPKDKVFFVPNTPEFRKTKRLPISKINKHDLVIVSNITRSIDYPLIIRTINRLSKKYEDIRLLIIGSGDYEEELKKLVRRLKLTKRVLFLGRKPHNEVLEILSKSSVGIALYTREHPWTEFGDSMKVREYMASGLPVIINDVPSTADDVEKENVGFVLRGKGQGFEKAVETLFSDEKLYRRMRKNAVSLAKAYDFTNVMNGVFGKLGLTFDK